MFKKLVVAAISSMFAVSIALAQSTAPGPASAPSAQASGAPTSGGCEAKAVGKDGKPLKGAAKNSFMKKCEGDMKIAAGAQCEQKAIDKNGKPLNGAAKTSFVKKCQATAAK